MTNYEIYALLKNAHVDMQGWEQTRMLVMVLANMFSKTKKNATDIIKFPWELEEGEKERITDISDDDIKRLEETARYYEAQFAAEKDSTIENG